MQDISGEGASRVGVEYVIATRSWRGAGWAAIIINVFIGQFCLSSPRPCLAIDWRLVNIIILAFGMRVGEKKTLSKEVDCGEDILK
jgi:hypothetical protein